MKLATVYIPAKRMVCCFCCKRLKVPTVCTSAGIVVLTCPEHDTKGDRMVQVAQILAIRSGQLERTEMELAGHN